MALIDKLAAIGNAIRAKTGKSGKLTLSQMVTEISSIQTGITPSGTLSITKNGKEDVTNYAEVDVNVPTGGLPAGIKAIAKGTHTLSSAVTGSSTFSVTHNLGEVPDMFLFYADGNIATTYSMIYAFRGIDFGWRSNTYLNHVGYHGNNATNLTETNVTTTYGIKTLTATTATITSYSTSTSYGWRAGNYKWIAIKFS